MSLFTMCFHLKTLGDRRRGVSAREYVAILGKSNIKWNFTRALISCSMSMAGLAGSKWITMDQWIIRV